MKTRTWLSVVLTIFALVIQGCLGPKPEVKEVRVSRSDSPESIYDVDVTIENKGRGAGQAELRARIIDLKSGRNYQESVKIDLKSGEVTSKRIAIRAPAADYKAEAEVEYPEM